jgi:SPP1 family predicted phage head-tail adaptor
MGKLIDAGKLDRRITIQRFQSVEDQYGDPLPQWTDLAVAWASAWPAPGSERLVNAEIAAQAMMVFRIRYSSLVADVNPKDRISYAGKTWAILSVMEIGRREGLEISARAGAD